MTRALLVDISAIAHASFHVTTNDADPNAMSNGTVARVRALATGYDHVAVCIDTGKSFRAAISESYKAHRESKPAHFHHQYKRAVEILEKDGYLTLGAVDFEADDAIATAVAWLRANAPDVDVVIASSDKDLCALIDERVTMWSLIKSATVDVAAVVAKFGVLPASMPDWLALTGDSSDAIQGIRGIGPKGASRLLARFGSITGIYAALNSTPEEVTPASVREALIGGVATLDLAIKLVALRTDAPIDCAKILERREVRPLSDEPTYSGEMEGDAVETVDEETGEVIEQPKPPPPPTELERPREPRPMATSSPSSSMVVTPPSWDLALEPTSTSSAYKIATSIFNSRMFANMPNADAVFAVILMGRTLGVDSLTMLRNVNVIEGKITLAASFIVGLVLRSGLADYFKCVETTSERATYKTHRKGDLDSEPTVMTYTVEDAKRQQLLMPLEPGKKPGNWHKMPGTMCRHRCSTELARAVYPDVVSGLYAPEEFQGGDSRVEAA